MTRAMGLEAKDPFLVEYKQNLQEMLKGMKSVGRSGLRLLIVEMIRSRWIKDRRASYPYEIAWVFDKNEDAVAKMLKRLEEANDIEQVGLRREKKGLVRPYKPRTLRKVPSN